MADSYLKNIDDAPELSDVNPDEMERMVQDMDDLDDDLFGASLKTQKSQGILEAPGSAAQPAPGIKKRVVFHGFNEDDPLADLLSDEDDFQEKPKPATANRKSNLMSDLFGIRSTDPLEPKVKEISELKSAPMAPKEEEIISKPASKANDWLGLTDDPLTVVQEPELTKPKTAPKVKSIFDNDDDIVASLTEKPRLPGDKTKKSSLMEDLFGNRPRSNPTKETYPRRDSIKLGLEKPAVQTKLEQPKIDQPKIDQPPKPGTGRYAPTVSGPREPRRGRRGSGSGIIVDPLGMFETANSEVNAVKSDYLSTPKLKDDNAFADEIQKPVEAQKGDLPEWLGGSKKSKDRKPQNENDMLVTKTKSSDQFSNTSVTDAKVPHKYQTIENPDSVQAPSLEYPINSAEHMSALVGTQFDQQAALMSLQHQEHELRTATVLSRHSEQLGQMLEHQKKKLDEQDKQFNILIKRQIDRQTLLEAQMKVQQDRINSHIQVLLAQPSTVPITTAYEESNKRTEEHITKETESESLVQKLQLEKLYLENTLDSLKEKHEREITIIEESYKKQIAYLEQGMEKLEKRLRQDAEIAEADYEAVIQKLKDAKASLELAHVVQIDNLKKEHAKHVQEIYDRQRHNIDLLQKEHAETIENIGKAKELERQAVSSTTTHSKGLGDMLQRAETVMSVIEDLQKRFESKDGNIEKSREIFLEKQEEELEALKAQLRRQQEALEFERKQLSEAAQKLDSGTSRLINESQKRSEDSEEAAERLKMREQSLIRERELFDAQILWERGHIQAMKDAWVGEQERQTKQLAEERQALASGKAKLEVLNRLKTGADDVAKAELEAAIRAAQDAANDTILERQKWRERLNDLEMQRQQFREKENQLTLRAKELENLTQSALEKRDEGLRALGEARHLEEQHRNHLGQLQMQLEALAQRENKLATEKVALARERLALRVTQAEKPEKDLSRSRVPPSYTDEPYHHSQIPPGPHTVTHFKDIVDPNLVLLKLGLDNELGTSNECIATMHTVSQ